MDEPDYPELIHNEDAGHLSDVPNGLPCRMSTLYRAESAPPDSRSHDLSQRAAAQAICRVGFSLGIGEARKGHSTLPTKGTGLLHVALADEDDLSSLLAKAFIVASQPGDVLATERSAVVAQENENGRSLRPKLRQAHEPTIGAHEFNIRRSIPNFKHRSSCADLALP